jgi:DNA-binding phage protein
LQLGRTSANIVAVMRLTLQAAIAKRRTDPDRLAGDAGVHRATVYRILAGDITNPSSDTVEKLELALRLKRGTLVFGDHVMAERAS